MSLGQTVFTDHVPNLYFTYKTSFNKEDSDMMEEFLFRTHISRTTELRNRF